MKKPVIYETKIPGEFVDVMSIAVCNFYEAAYEFTREKRNEWIVSVIVTEENVAGAFRFSLGSDASFDFIQWSEDDSKYFPVGLSSGMPMYMRSSKSCFYHGIIPLCDDIEDIDGIIKIRAGFLVNGEFSFDEKFYQVILDSYKRAFKMFNIGVIWDDAEAFE